MSDRPEFGISFVPSWENPAEALRLTQLADERGYDLVGIQDHPYQWRFLDTWTLISWLAAQTARIRFFPDVANLPLRPPAVLAKAAASLDVLTGGRIELGLGAGWAWDAIEAMGGPRRSPAEAVGAAEEGFDVIRLVWTGAHNRRYDGRFYRLAGVNAGPKPAHPIGIWIGAYGDRMLDLIGRKADGWVPSARPGVLETLPDGIRKIEDAAARVGRDPKAIRRVLNIGGAIEDRPPEPFVGPATFWVEELTRLAVDVGMDGFIFWASHDQDDQIRAFASEVIPGVREAVARERPDP